jgi:hypothetical protein
MPRKGKGLHDTMDRECDRSNRFQPVCTVVSSFGDDHKYFAAGVRSAVGVSFELKRRHINQYVVPLARLSLTARGSLNNGITIATESPWPRSIGNVSQLEI